MLKRFKMVGGGNFVHKGQTYHMGDEVTTTSNLEKHNAPNSVKFERLADPPQPVIESLEEIANPTVPSPVLTEETLEPTDPANSDAPVVSENDGTQTGRRKRGG